MLPALVFCRPGGTHWPSPDKVVIMRLRPWTKTLYFLAILPVLVGVLFPFAVMLSTSLKSPEEISGYGETRYSLIPRDVEPSNFIGCFKAMDLGQCFLNSLIVAVGATLLNMLCAIPAAYALSRLSFPGKTGALFTILVLRGKLVTQDSYGPEVYPTAP